MVWKTVNHEQHADSGSSADSLHNILSSVEDRDQLAKSTSCSQRLRYVRRSQGKNSTCFTEKGFVGATRASGKPIAGFWPQTKTTQKHCKIAYEKAPVLDTGAFYFYSWIEKFLSAGEKVRFHAGERLPNPHSVRGLLRRGSLRSYARKALCLFENASILADNP